ncbi:exopolysaccharide biosynthesis polyprenyl glycosylphosphotransferase [Candidatus Falkowbacteria bacterium]|nr:exopolysaccharide biosynthesis polyprenyl glycosylphosphotransferase [Candidatus Falkowbacteria bacterium]
MISNRDKKIFLIAGDIFILYLSLYLTLLIRYGANPSNELWARHLSPFTAIFAIWIMIFYISGLYNLNIAVTNLFFFKRMAKGLLLGASAAVLFFYVVPSVIAPKTNLAIFIAVFALMFFFWRQLFNWSLSSYMPKNKIAIIGQSQLIREIVEVFRTKPHLGMKIAFILDPGEKYQKELGGVPIFSDINDLERLIKKKNISSIILAANPNESDKLRGILFKCLPMQMNFLKLIDFYESITGRVPIDVINKMWFLENLSEGNKKFFDLIKRSFDLFLSILLLLISLPFWIVIALIIKLESKGPVFFTQTRCGQEGKRFKMIKFRTMREEGNNHAPTLEKDDRITKFGNFLRKSRIDEIPQMLNILLGDMSFIGPRPERPELVEELEKAVPFYRERMLVRPGVTGWDQVCGEYHSPSLEDTMKKLQYDLFYIKNRSPLLELSIILKTINTVFSRAGR